VSSVPEVAAADCTSGESCAKSAETPQSRDIRIDVLRGLAICLVVFGHLLSGGAAAAVVGALIASFHMPLFVSLSGYLAFKVGRRTRWQWLGGKARQLLLPYAVFVLASYALGFGWSDTHVSLWQYSVRALLYADPAWWFLYVLFSCFALLALCTIPSGVASDIALIAVAAALWVVFRLTGSYLLGLGYLHWYFTFFAGSYLLAKYRSRWQGVGTWMLATGVVAYPFLMAKTVGLTPPPWFRAILMAATPIKVIAAAFAVAVAGTCVATLVAFLLARTPLASLFSYLGRNTLDLFLLTSLVIGIYTWTLHQSPPAGIAAASAMSAAATVVALGLARLIDLSPELATIILGHPYRRGRQAK